MICFPNCKINLGLAVTEKRLDGYHNIETVFYPVNLRDALEVIVINEKFNFQTSGLEIPTDKNLNLCFKAYELLKKDFNLLPIQMHLHKIIPVGSGLGGGSSDATFTIKLLNDLFLLNLSEKQMEDYVCKLGSDCAFFIKNKPLFAYEKGDRFESIELNLSKYYIVIVKPDIYINTAEAYNGIKLVRNELSIKEIIKKPIEEWKFILHNDFESSIFRKYPEIRKIKEIMYALNAVYASMSGSGSAIYGIFEEKIKIANKIFPGSYFLWQNRMM